MRALLIAACMLAPCGSTTVWAQACKPDVARQDKISKQQVDIWVQELFATSFGASLMSTSEVGITATVGRYGDLNAINLQIQKKEESATNAAFEMAFRATKGSPFYLGFKTGDPVALVVTEVGNAANVQQGLFSAKGVTTVVLSAVVGDQEMASLREALTSRQVDAVRIRLSGDQLIEKSVSDKNGKKLMDKFTCFYAALDKRGVDLSASQRDAVSPGEIAAGGETRDYSLTAPGKYAFRKGGAKPGDYIDLDPSGRLFLRQNGRSFGGTYYVRGDVLTIVWASGQADRAKFSGNTLIDSEGWIWEKPADEAKPQAIALTVDKIVEMVGAKIPDDVIISSIEKAGAKFNLTPDDLIKLKGAGVSDAVLRAMSN